MKYRKWLLRVLIGCYLLLDGIACYLNYQAHDLNGIMMGVVALITPILVPFAFRLLKWNMTFEVKVVNIIFMLFASVMGSCFHWYRFPYFDKVLHFSSGLFGTIVAILLFCIIKQQKKITDKQDYSIFLIFINAVNMCIALLWEFYEYAMLVLFNNDAINHFTTGVHDSITDMMCATVAGLLITVLVYRYNTTGKSNFFIRLYETMYDENIAKKRKSN